ncbi:flippase Wzx [Streptococcus criceti]|uniref:Membrane protein n=1 Tax=Streptococcus criceti HS-6 TaxID=873449 RepID=G5JNF4_STRCG|nr:flippase [Streptococcus criceti]EHI74059.1 putative membrane protein [Streptococcus criceti HS-6]SUN43349.1 flippase Wzx [Streptococcus criceti]
MVQKKVSVQMNIIMNFLLTISNIIFPLITFPYVSRVLMPVGTGKVAFATSIVSYFAMVGMLGIPTYGIRACAKVRDDKDKLSKTVQEIMVINTVAMTLSLVTYIMAIMAVPRMAQDRTLFMINIATLVFNLIGCEWLYKALEQYTYITVRSVALKFVSLVLMFLVVRQRGDYVLYGAITILASVGSNFFNFINLRKYLNLKWYSGMDLKQHIQPIFSFFMMTVATTIYTNLDSVMLGFMKNDTAVGYYNASVKIKTILVSLVTSMGSVLLPRLSYYVKHGKKEEFRVLTVRSLQFIGFIAIPLWAYFTLFAKQGIDFLSGPDYAGSVLPMQLIMPTLFFIGLSNLLGIQILVPMERENQVLKSVILGAFVDLIINVMAIPRFGAAGAAFGTLVAEFFVVAYQIFVLRDFLKEVLPQVRIYKNILATVLASLAACMLYASCLTSLSSFLVLVASAAVFGLVYLLVSFLLKDAFLLYFVSYYKK